MEVRRTAESERELCLDAAHDPSPGAERDAGAGAGERPPFDRLATTYHAWRGEPEADEYEDVAGFCKSVALDEIRGHGHVLTPGRYVGIEDIEDDDEPVEEKIERLVAKLEAQFAESSRLEVAIRKNLQRLAGQKNL